jgi:hypothetical protein
MLNIQIKDLQLCIHSCKPTYLHKVVTLNDNLAQVGKRKVQVPNPKNASRQGSTTDTGGYHST